MKSHLARFSAISLGVALGMTMSSALFAQSFQKISVQGKAKMSQAAAGAVSVWALAANGHPYVFKTNKFVQASTVSLSQIAVGGGNILQPDTVWALDSSGQIYNAAQSGSSWTFGKVAGSGFFTHIEAGPGRQDGCHPYEVWGLNSGAQIFRYDFCRKVFDTIPGILCTLAVAGGDVWGNDCNGTVFRFDWTDMSFHQWSSGSGLPVIAAGPDSVWGINRNPTVVDIVPSATAVFSVNSSINWTIIHAGGDGVWGLDASGLVYFLRYSQWDFVQVPNTLLTSISVGSGTGVWGIDPNGQILAFSMQ